MTKQQGGPQSSAAKPRRKCRPSCHHRSVVGRRSTQTFVIQLFFIYLLLETTRAFAPVHPKGSWPPILVLLSDTSDVSSTRSSQTSSRSFSLLFATKPSQEEEIATNQHATPSQSANNDKNMNEEGLSDVDARVLREILQDSQSLDLQTEQGIKDLLKRGVVKKTKLQEQQEWEALERENDGNTDSEYESSAMKAFTDSKLWQKLSRKAEDVLESARIWIENKVEKDVQTLAALGLFAWDRIQKDVSRALPAAGSSARKFMQFQLSNSSSFATMQQEQEAAAQKEQNRLQSLKNELNRPEDEIKLVTRAIWDILKGENVETTTAVGGSRGLRTTAPAGIANMAERQRRALKQRRQLDRQDRDVTRVGGRVIDSAYELRRELQAETNTAGYKTKPIRKAIQAGVQNTGKLLQAVQETARLAAAKRKAERLAAAGETAASSTTGGPVDVQPASQEVEPIVALGLTEEELLVALQQERLAVDERLTKCIAEPENTWLSTDVVTHATMQDLSEDSLREIATIMVLVRDEMDAQVQAFMQDSSQEVTIPEVMDQLRADLGSIKELRSRVAGSVSFLIAEQLYNEILGLPMSIDTEDDVETVMELPIILRLPEIQEQLDNPLVPPPPAPSSPQPEATGTTASMPFPFFVAEEGDSVVDQPTTTSSFTAPENFFDVTNAKGRPSRAASPPRNVNVGADVVTAATVVNSGRGGAAPFSSANANLDVENVAFVDLIPDAVAYRKSNVDNVMDSAISENNAEVVVEVGGESFSAEIVTDDDFDMAVGEAKRVAAVATDGCDGDLHEEEQEPNMVTVVVLRSLDVVFFVFEKLFTVAIPRTLTIGTNIGRRLQEAQQEGRGSQGWKPIRQTVSARGRY